MFAARHISLLASVATSHHLDFYAVPVEGSNGQGADWLSTPKLGENVHECV